MLRLTTKVSDLRVRSPVALGSPLRIGGFRQVAITSALHNEASSVVKKVHPELIPMWKPENRNEALAWGEKSRSWRATAESGVVPSIELTREVFSFLCENGSEHELTKRIRTAREYNVDFDKEIYENIIKLYLKRLNYVTAHAYAEEMFNEGIEISTETLHSLLRELERRGERKKMKSFFEVMQQRKQVTADTYNIFISMHAKRELSPKKALAWLDDLLKSDIQPNEESFLPIFKYYFEHTERYSMMKYWGIMRENNVKPTIKSYQLIMRIIFIWHKEQEITEWLEKMQKEDGIMPSVVIYRYLLKHCIFMGDQELAFKWVNYMQNIGINPDDENVIFLLRKLRMYKKGEVLDPTNFTEEQRMLPWKHYMPEKQKS